MDNQEYIERKWSKEWGDRMNELVFIGQDIEKEKMIADLENCLLKENEQQQFDRKDGFLDPFPQNF